MLRDDTRERLFASPLPRQQLTTSRWKHLSPPFNQINDCSPDALRPHKSANSQSLVKSSAHASPFTRVKLDTGASANTVSSSVFTGAKDESTNYLSRTGGESKSLNDTVSSTNGALGDTSREISNVTLISPSPPLFKPIDIKCFLEPVYYTLPFLAMRNKQKTIGTVRRVDESDGCIDDNNNNITGIGDGEYGRVKCTMKRATSINGSLVKRLSAAGVSVKSDHAISIVPNSLSTGVPKYTAHVNDAYDDDDGEGDDSTYDTYGPRFSRITLLDVPNEEREKVNTLQSTSVTRTDDVRNAGASSTVDAAATAATGYAGDLKSKPQRSINLQRLFIKQSPCVESFDHNGCADGTRHSETNFNPSATPAASSSSSTSKQSHSLSPHQFALNSKMSANNIHTSQHNRDDFNSIELQPQRSSISPHSACNDDKFPSRSQMSSSPISTVESTTYSDVSVEMNGEGFKRWSRSKAAKPFDAAYNPSLSPITGSNLQVYAKNSPDPTALSLHDAQLLKSGTNLSLKFSKRIPLSLPSSAEDTIAVKGLSYIRKQSLPKHDQYSGRSNNSQRTSAKRTIADSGSNARRGSVMTTIFGQVGDRRFSQDLRSPNNSFPVHNSRTALVNSGDGGKGETAKVIFFQVFIPFLVAGFGNVGAGLILDHVQFWPVFRASKELFILVASFLGFKGNLEMTLAARLATQANCGQLDTPLEQIQVGIGNVALIQAQATVVAFLAAIIAITISYFKDFTFQFESSLLIMTTSLVTAAITGLFLSMLMIIVTILSRKIGINPDNVSTLLAAFLGDISAVILLAGSAKLFYDYRYVTWLQPGVCIAFFIILPVFLIIARKNRYTHDVVGTGWYPIIIAMVISSIAGLIFDLAVEKYETIALLQPIINGVGANLVAVQASRISTYFHQRATLGSMPRDDDGKFYRICQSPIAAFIGRNANVRTARLLVAMSIVGNIIYFVTVRLIQSGKIFVTLPFISFYLSVGILQVVILLYMAHVLVPFLWSKKLDPDNAAIPGIMACGDLLGTAFLTLAYIILNAMDDPNIYHSFHDPDTHIVVDSNLTSLSVNSTLPV